MKKSIIVAALFMAATALNAQTNNQKLLSFESGKPAEKTENQITSYGWKFTTDVWSISDDMNHTKNGKHSLHYVANAPTEKNRTAATQKKMNQLITLEDGIYQAKLWVFVKSGKLSNFELKFPEVKIKEGKVLKAKAKETPDFVSAPKTAKVKVGDIENGKWIQLTSGPFYKGDEKHIELLKSHLNIIYPKGAEAVDFYIDDIKFIKKEAK